MGKRSRLLCLVLPALLALLLGATGCAPAARPQPRRTPRPSPTATPLPSQLTVIAPLGVNIRSAPSLQASVVGELAQGATAQLVSHTSQQGGWWQITGSAGSGWVSADPQYTSTESFETYEAGGAVSWSVMYETGWTFSAVSAAEVEFTDSSGGAVTFYSAPSTASLPAAAPSGATQKSVGSTEVYGFTAPLVTYVSSTSYEASVELQAVPGLALLITCELPAAGGAATLQLFLQTVYIA